MIQFELSLRQY